MDNSNQLKPPGELTPPKVEISLDYYLSLACRGIENKAVVSLSFGEELKKLDANEDHCHVEIISETLAEIYPIKEWKDSVKRLENQRQASELTRKIRFALEQEQKELKGRVQRRRDILAETVADVKKLVPGITQKLAYKYGITHYKQQEEWLEYTCFRALMGEHPKAAEKFKLGAELIKEFSTLPVDPEFNNRYWLGSKETNEL